MVVCLNAWLEYLMSREFVIFYICRRDSLHVIHLVSFKRNTSCILWDVVKIPFRFNPFLVNVPFHHFKNTEKYLAFWNVRRVQKKNIGTKRVKLRKVLQQTRQNSTLTFSQTPKKGRHQTFYYQKLYLYCAKWRMLNIYSRDFIFHIF